MRFFPSKKSWKEVSAERQCKQFLLHLPVEFSGVASCNCVNESESDETVFFLGVCLIVVCLGTMGLCEQDAF